MLIFDNFPSVERAEGFREWVRKWSRGKLRVYIFDSQEEASKVDPFPFYLSPPIVMVDRSKLDNECVMARRVKRFGGVFAGT